MLTEVGYPERFLKNICIHGIRSQRGGLLGRNPIYNNNVAIGRLMRTVKRNSNAFNLTLSFYGQTVVSVQKR